MTQNLLENITKATAKSINKTDPAIIKAQEACSSLKDAYDMFDTKYEIKQDLDEIQLRQVEQDEEVQKEKSALNAVQMVDGR